MFSICILRVICVCMNIFFMRIKLNHIFILLDWLVNEHSIHMELRMKEKKKRQEQKQNKKTRG